ncbi:MAG TPA: hypothetical protein PLH07_06980 [Sulfurovum sp.]|jgi:hypothetical protein|nr:MAG: hypothetical protein B7Y63_04925 [Sulfurovum sp. 35-42-20]OYY55806.1 MAG: hypothetical protein B7Y52_04795 [Sulfurovum sp. 28-43-6]OYZ25401.1 MAG: hypothetical protein B7Y23_05690 [Sulfurovum sp. 16-42-52]OYZ49869.1 MAG: hypothetical protein B7Y13_03145 [Sulfurovum sp. 24-42-9]OZA45497.1 MAG: hypothetical protein B7X80_05000 [Sulfurovum sp. 17-42-90]OZA59228.1 MAG: hypothetical protein B7X69_08840 [Sulfurovum sp. 39-42-12]HQR74369.1 hypothetical protein [Sulfurovum sp.]
MSSGYLLRVLTAVCAVSLSAFGAQTLPHPFEVETGMVTYDITSEAVLTPDTNLSIKGKGKLRFSDWGDTRIEEEENLVSTTGALKHQQKVKRFKKYTKDSVITVDYENEQLLERKNATGYNAEEQTRFLTQNGQEEVAGISCDVWEGVGIKKCIYKGIVLLSESKVLDMHYTKRANSVTLDINASKEGCDTPDFPMQEFALIHDTIATQNALQPEKFSVVFNEAVYDINENNTSYGDNNITDEERVKFINYLGQNIYKRQKELLPALLISIKEARECLQTANDPVAANECMESLNAIKTELGAEGQSYILLWDEKQKSLLLDSVEDELIELESRMACINRALNITDLSACMK